MSRECKAVTGGVTHMIFTSCSPIEMATALDQTMTPRRVSVITPFGATAIIFIVVALSANIILTIKQDRVARRSLISEKHPSA
jgi:hypothetical protein